jgi:hypothetical protein
MIERLLGRFFIGLNSSDLSHAVLVSMAALAMQDKMLKERKIDQRLILHSPKLISKQQTYIVSAIFIGYCIKLRQFK